MDHFTASEIDSTFNKEWNVQRIKEEVTAESFCSCRDPIVMAFRVSRNCGHCPCGLAGCG